MDTFFGEVPFLFNYMGKHPKTSLQLHQVNLPKSRYAIAFGKHFHLKDPISGVLFALHRQGILEALQQRWIKTDQFQYHEKQSIQFSCKAFRNSFLFLTVAVVVSILMLLVERCLVHMNKWKNNYSINRNNQKKITNLRGKCYCTLLCT